MAQAVFPEPQSLNVLEIGDGRDHNVGKYTLDKPHPAYGKDDNIINQLGHTTYPKMVYPNGVDSPYVVVNSAEQEAEVMGSAEKLAQSPVKKPGNDW